MNENDTVEKAIEFMQQNKVDSKRLANALPSTAQDLRDGSIDPLVLAARLLDLAVTQGVLVIGSEDEQYEGTKVLAELLSFVLCRYAVSPVADADLCYGIHESLEVSYGHAIAGKSSEQLLAHFPQIVKKVFDKTCEKWEVRVADRLFQGQVGVFRRSCVLFNAPVKKFKHVLDEVVYPKYFSGDWACIDSFQKLLIQATSGISGGLDEEKETCWNCGETVATISTCAKCGCAQYCGRECQGNAWKSGHKNACKKLLKWKRTTYAKSIIHIHGTNDHTIPIRNVH
jgi:hypothetical protein